jgi:2-dehydropantoate 2-reductase
MSANSAATQRVCVVGCGAVGGLFAAHLAQLEDVEVWVYDTDTAHVDAINDHGLRVSGHGELVGRLQATADPLALPACDYGLVATKARHTEAAIDAVQHALADGATCSMQNGIGNEEVLARYLQRVIRGTTFPGGRVTGPGAIRWDTAGESWIGPFEPKPASPRQVSALAELLTRAGMPTRALPDARGAQWTKLIFNAATNPIGALTRLSHGEACDVPALRDLIRGLASEGRSVAEALGIELDADPDEMIDRAAVTAHDHQASMLQDVRAGRLTEVDVLNGGISRAGAEVGVETPLNDAVWALVRGLEHSIELGRAS